MTAEGTCNTLSMRHTKSSSSSAEMVVCCSVGSVDVNKDALVDSDPGLVVKPPVDTNTALRTAPVAWIAPVIGTPVNWSCSEGSVTVAAVMSVDSATVVSGTFTLSTASLIIAFGGEGVTGVSVDTPAVPVLVGGVSEVTLPSVDSVPVSVAAQSGGGEEVALASVSVLSDDNDGAASVGGPVVFSFSVPEESDSGPRVLEDEAVSSEAVDATSALVLVGGATDVFPFIQTAACSEGLP